MLPYSAETSIIKATPSITPSDHNPATAHRAPMHIVVHFANKSVYTVKGKMTMLAVLLTLFLCVRNYVYSFSVLEILRVAVVVGICQILCVVFSFTKTPPDRKNTSHTKENKMSVPMWTDIPLVVRNGNFSRHCFYFIEIQN
ncbi:hypothetical protein CBL_12281 [Carabus blaptoides fortunei]